MRYFPAALEKLTEQFARLPGIGGKTAQRLAFHVLSLPDGEAEEFAAAILEAKQSVRAVPGVSESDRSCAVPHLRRPETRDHSTICVVAEPKDVIAMERAREYHGVYHVLHGVISPLNHMGPDDIRIRELLTRISDRVRYSDCQTRKFYKH
jgi:recombination protein RecR